MYSIIVGPPYNLTHLDYGYLINNGCVFIGSPNVISLRGEVFFRVSLDHALMQQLYGKLDDMEGIFTLTRACGEESITTLRKCHNLPDEEFRLMVKSMPVRCFDVDLYRHLIYHFENAYYKVVIVLLGQHFMVMAYLL